MHYVYWVLGLWAYIAVAGMRIDEEEVFPHRLGFTLGPDSPREWPWVLFSTWILIPYTLIEGPTRLCVSMWRHRPQISLRKRDEN